MMNTFTPMDISNDDESSMLPNIVEKKIEAPYTYTIDEIISNLYRLENQGYIKIHSFKHDSKSNYTRLIYICDPYKSVKYDKSDSKKYHLFKCHFNNLLELNFQGYIVTNDSLKIEESFYRQHKGKIGRAHV